MTKLTEAQLAFLDYAKDSTGTATHWFVHLLPIDERGVRRARRILNGLRIMGFLEGIRASRSGRIFWWCITAAGRAALSQDKGEGT